MLSLLLPKPKHATHATVKIVLPKETTSAALVAPTAQLAEIVQAQEKKSLAQLHIKLDTSLDYAKTIATAKGTLTAVQTSHDDTIPLKVKYPNLKHHFPRYTLETCPDDSLKTCLEETREVIEKLLSPAADDENKGPAVVNYTPNSLGEERKVTIEVTNYKEDPMLPPKFKLRKNRERPPSPPPPVLKAQPKEKVTKEMKDKWHIPSAVSNWKNNMGFAISLDKRVKAASGGSSGDGTNINIEKFSELSEALSNADKQAREDIRIRNENRKQMALQEQQEKEAQLKKLVEQSRQGKRQAEHDDRSRSKYRRM